MIGRLLPAPLRRRLRALLDRSRLDPDDVARVRAVTAAQWRTVGARAPHHADAYWAGVDESAADSVAKRRSEWLADLAPFRSADSALELGCNVGRNLWMLQQRYPAMALRGVDIDAEAIAYARSRVKAEFLVGDLYDVERALGDWTADVVFTMGVLIHLHPATLPPLLETMARRARRHVVLVEQISADNVVVKGPARWRPERRVTGEYIQWSPDLAGMLAALGLRHTVDELPPEVAANGARHLVVVEPRGTRA
jgi:SAM-dependent methyltransferase